MAISYVIIQIYVCLALGKFHTLYSRVLLGVGGVFGLLLATACALGITSLLQVQFSPISLNVLPYLLLGIGVDNMFIIADVYNHLASTVHDDPKYQHMLENDPQRYVRPCPRPRCTSLIT